MCYMMEWPRHGVAIAGLTLGDQGRAMESASHASALSPVQLTRAARGIWDPAEQREGSTHPLSASPQGLLR